MQIEVASRVFRNPESFAMMSETLDCFHQWEQFLFVATILFQEVLF